VPQTLGAPPDNQQGFGRLDLSLSLLSSSSTPANGGLGLWCSDDESVASSDENTYYFYVVSSGQPLTVTLAWTDPPNSVGASKQLLHDLDLTVHHESSGDVFYSNGNLGTADQDEVNTVEKVAVASPATGSYAIKVKASVLTQSTSQAFALVITGGGYLVASGYTWARISSGEAGPTGAPTITFPPTVSPQPTPPPSPLPSPAPTVSFRPTLVPSLRTTSVPTAPTSAPTVEMSSSLSNALDWFKDHIVLLSVSVRCPSSTQQPSPSPCSDARRRAASPAGTIHPATRWPHCAFGGRARDGGASGQRGHGALHQQPRHGACGDATGAAQPQPRLPTVIDTEEAVQGGCKDGLPKGEQHRTGGFEPGAVHRSGRRGATNTTGSKSCGLCEEAGNFPGA